MLMSDVVCVMKFVVYNYAMSAYLLPCDPVCSCI